MGLLLILAATGSSGTENSKAQPASPEEVDRGPFADLFEPPRVERGHPSYAALHFVLRVLAGEDGERRAKLLADRPKAPSRLEFAREFHAVVKLLHGYREVDHAIILSSGREIDDYRIKEIAPWLEALRGEFDYELRFEVRDREWQDMEATLKMVKRRGNFFVHYLGR